MEDEKENENEMENEEEERKRKCRSFTFPFEFLQKIEDWGMDESDIEFFIVPIPHHSLPTPHQRLLQRRKVLTHTFFSFSPSEKYSRDSVKRASWP